VPPTPLRRYNTFVPASFPDQTALLRLLVSRLERLSVDSHWARRASGLRGNLVKLLEEADSGQDVSSARLELLTDAAFDILRRAALDIPDLEELLKRK
jgi:hypothetical protein